MRTAILLMFLFSPAFAFLGNIVSFGLDNVPVIGNIKNSGEAITGRDMVTMRNYLQEVEYFLYCVLSLVLIIKKTQNI